MKNQKITNVDIVSALGLRHTKVSQSEEGPTLQDLIKMLMMLPRLFVRKFKTLPREEQREIMLIMLLILLLLPLMFLLFYILIQVEK
ncbi:hypothetical protein [Sphingobacterium sp. UBA6645]|uniref:hypothetical protein n=1 Tax=Sphingobacterium sp. UBA6645 TaxID=1947511 RepID=UPI0025DA2A2D|nr:hypothetical protein [Sphingobacterium sp. UBA6645]